MLCFYIRDRVYKIDITPQKSEDLYTMRVPISETSIRDYLLRIEPLAKAFDLLSDHTVITDPNANILYANKTVEKQTGFSPEASAVGKGTTFFVRIPIQ